MPWAPTGSWECLSAPNSCLHPADLEHNRAPSSTPPSMKSVRLGGTSNSGQHRLVSWSKSDQVAIPRLCWLKSQHRWLMNMKRLFNVKKPLIFFFQINSFSACKLYPKLWAREKGHFNQNSKHPCLVSFLWVPNQGLKYMFVHSLFVWFVWGRGVKDTAVGCFPCPSVNKGNEKILSSDGRRRS